MGRADSGTFIEIPAVGMRAIELLESGLTVGDTRLHIRKETGNDCDVAGFVSQLAALGMVNSVDGQQIPSTEPINPTLPRVEQRHVRWLLHPSVPWLVGAVLALGVAAAFVHPDSLPRWEDLVWSEHGTPVLLLESALAWLLIFVHESAHLLTARAAGVPGRMRLGTRLQFLVAETEISGIWLCCRRVRVTAYLAGMASDALVCSLCLIVMTATDTSPLILRLVILNKALSVASEFMVFMRTDIYFLLQDLSRCRNMFGDALVYLRFLCRRLIGRLNRSPLASLPDRERKVVRVYAVLMVLGSTISLGLGAIVIFYFTGPLLFGAVGNLTGPGWVDAIDGLTTLLLIGGMQLLWAGAWWRRHGPRARRVLGALVRRSPRKDVRRSASTPGPPPPVSGSL
ncbi:hypothetical protein [Streptomyces sp. NPDC093544]|uniref:hypothetical protein n=1 Tax=Streptomyces sp. NPDC093544 TaxID=3155200 RepID=UPI0034277529